MSKEKKIASNLADKVHLMRIRQISEHTSLSKPYLYKLIAEGDFPDSLLINGIRVWKKESIDQWLEVKFNEVTSC